MTIRSYQQKPLQQIDPGRHGMHQSDGGNRFTFFVHDNRYMKRIFLLITLILLAPAAFAHKVALLSTQFVLEHKFRLMQAASEGSGINLHWVQADREGEEGVRKALAEARLVIIDAPRAEDQAQIEHIAGKLLREKLLYLSSPFKPSAARSARYDWHRKLPNDSTAIMWPARK